MCRSCVGLVTELNAQLAVPPSVIALRRHQGSMKLDTMCQIVSECANCARRPSYTHLAGEIAVFAPQILADTRASALPVATNAASQSALRSGWGMQAGCALP